MRNRRSNLIFFLTKISLVPVGVRRPRLGASLQASSSSGTYLLCWAAKGCRPWRERDHACSDAAARTRAPGEHWMRAARRRVVIGGATGKTSLRHRTCMLGRDDGASSCHPWRAAPPELAPRTPFFLSFPGSSAATLLQLHRTFPINGSAAVCRTETRLSCSARPLNEDEWLLARSQTGQGRNGRRCSSSAEISPNSTLQEAFLVVPMQNCTKTILFKPWLQVQYMLLV